MIQLVWWILIFICFIGSFIALVKPIIPGLPLLWVGYFIYYFLINKNDLGLWFWFIQIIFTLFVFGIDILSNRYFLKKQGSSKQSEKIGMVSIIIGSFVFPPFGLVLVPFITVFFSEISQRKSSKQAAKIAFATVVSFLTSTIAKLLLQIIMILLFFVWIL